jgi:Flp pilus assembly protein TadD
VEVAVNMGCVLYKEGDYEAAAAKFKEAAALDSNNLVRRLLYF